MTPAQSWEQRAYGALLRMVEHFGLPRPMKVSVEGWSRTLKAEVRLPEPCTLVIVPRVQLEDGCLIQAQRAGQSEPTPLWSLLLLDTKEVNQ